MPALALLAVWWLVAVPWGEVFVALVEFVRPLERISVSCGGVRRSAEAAEGMVSKLLVVVALSFATAAAAVVCVTAAAAAPPEEDDDVVW